MSLASSRHIIVLVLLVPVLLTIFPGANLEAYESMLAAMVAGVYTAPCVNDWNNDLQFVLLALYARLNAWLPAVPVYGIALYLSTVVGLALSGSAFYGALRRSGYPYATWLFLLLYTAAAADNLQNLNSDRVAFYLAAGVLGWMELFRLEGKRLPAWIRISLGLFFLYACLVRSEVVLLVVLFAGALLFAFRRLHAGLLLPLTVSLAFFLGYNFLVLRTATHEKQAAFYKEKQIIDRNDIDYARIDSALRLEVDAFKIHYIMDKPHFDMAFYDVISKRGRSGEGLTRLTDGVSVDTLVPALQKTLGEIRKYGYWVLSFVILSLLILLLPVFNTRYAWLVFGSLLFPLALGLYVLVPDRFLMPYFSTLSVLALLRLLYSGSSHIRWVLPAAGLLLLPVLLTALEKQGAYDAHRAGYASGKQRLEAIERTFAVEQPVVIQHIDPMKFFSPGPFTALPASRSVFLNFYYFGSYECYTRTWRDLCGCDPFALDEKTDYLLRHGNAFVASPDKVEFLLKYLDSKYGRVLKVTLLGSFDKELNVYRLQNLTAE